jgi:glycosyltransferase involved in cell wall biosynthesis
MDPVKKKVLEKLSKQLNISDHISIFPPVTYDQIPNYIDLCDIGIIPLPVNHIWWHVSAPMKSLEYLSRGKPIIATEIPFHKRIFEKGDCGILIKIASKKDIKKAITDAYVNREKLHELGKNGKTIVKQYFTWDHSADRLVDFLKKNIL